MASFKQFFFRQRRYRELSESIREHIQEKVADLMERGVSRNEAEQTARREFGNVTLIEERGRARAGFAGRIAPDVTRREADVIERG